MERNFKQKDIELLKTELIELISSKFYDIEISRYMDNGESLTEEEVSYICKWPDSELEANNKLNWLINRSCFVFSDKNGINKKNEIIFDREKKEVILKMDIYNTSYKKENDIKIGYKDFFTIEIFDNIMYNLATKKSPRNDSQRDINYLTIIATIIKFYREINESNKQIITTKYIMSYLNSEKVREEYYNQEEKRVHEGTIINSIYKCEELIKAFILAGDIEIVRYFIRNGIDITTIPNVDKLVFASGNSDLVHYYEEELTGRPEYKVATYNALEGACMSNNAGIVEYLFNNYNINQINNEDSLIKVFSIIRDPWVAYKVLDKLKELDHNINKTDNDGKTILEYAVENEHFEVIQFLLVKLDREYNILPAGEEKENKKREINDLLESSKTVIFFRFRRKKISINSLFKILYKVSSIDKRKELINKDGEFGEEIFKDFVQKNGIKLFVQFFEDIHEFLSSNDVENMMAVDNIFGGVIEYYAKKNKVESLFNEIFEVLSRKDIENMISLGDNWNKTIYHSFLKNGDTEIIEILLKKIYNRNKGRKNLVDANGTFGKMILYYAVKEKNAEITGLLFQRMSEILTNKEEIKSLINIRDNNGRPILNYAIESNNFSMIALLLSRDDIDVDAEYKDELGNVETPLTLAIKKNDVKMINKLFSVIDKRNNSNLKIERGYELLYMAIENNNSDTVRALISQKSIDIDEELISFAIKKGNVEIVDLLLNREKDNLSNEFKNKIFIDSIIEGNSKMAECLFCDIPKNPFSKALNITKEELENKNIHALADLKVQYSYESDKQKKNILRRMFHYFILEEEDTEIIESLFYKISKSYFLRDKIGDIMDIKNFDRNIFYPAVKKGNIKMVELLLKEMSKILSKDEMDKLINKKYDDKNSILHLAIKNDNVELVKLLLEQPWTDVNLRDKQEHIITRENGKTPLFLAIEKGNPEIVKLLLNHTKIDSNATLKTTDNKYNYGIDRPYYNNKVIEKNSLIFAIEKGNPEIIKLLVESEDIDINKGAVISTAPNDGSIFDKEEIVPINLAVRNRNIEVVVLLLSNPKINVNAKCVIKHPSIKHKNEYRDEFYEEGTPLCFAIKNGDSEMVRLLLSNPNVDLNARYIHNETVRTFMNLNDKEIRTDDIALHMAIEGGDPNIIEPILNYIKKQNIIFSKKEKNNLIPRIIYDLNNTRDKSKYNIFKYCIDNGIICVGDIYDYYDKNTTGPDKKTLLEAFYKNKDFGMFEYFSKNNEWEKDAFEVIIDLTTDIYSSNNPELIDMMERYRNYLNLSEEYKAKYINNKLKTAIQYGLGNNFICTLVDKYFDFIETHYLEKLIYKIDDPKLTKRIFDKLEKNEYDMNEKDRIYYAFENKNVELSKLLFERMSKNISEEEIKYLLELKDLKKELKKNIKNKNIELIKLIFNHPVLEKDDFIESFSKIKNLEIAKIIFNEFLEKGYDINEKDETGKTLFYYAVEGGNIEVTKFLLEQQEIDPNVQIERRRKEYTYHNETPLNCAIRRNDIEMVRLLLNDPKVDPNLADEWEKGNNYFRKTTPLYKAINRENLKILELLLCNPKIDVNEKINHKSPLEYAIEKGKTEVVRLLLTHPNIEVNEKNNWDNKIPILTAVEKGNLKIVEYLLKYPSIKLDGLCEKLLETAIEGKNKEITNLLILYALEKKIRIDENLKDRVCDLLGRKIEIEIKEDNNKEEDLNIDKTAKNLAESMVNDNILSNGEEITNSLPDSDIDIELK